MSGDTFSHAVDNGEEEVSFIKTKRPRVNLEITVREWCARETWKDPCDVLLDVKGYQLCQFCVFCKKFNIPMMIEKAKREHPSNLFKTPKEQEK